MATSPTKSDKHRQHQLRIGGEKVLTVDDDASVMECIQQIINMRMDEYASDAFHMVSISSLLYKWRHWFTCMPGVHPFYAVKANPDMVILRLLAMLGANFDCASRGEIEKILSLDVAPERIIFANTTKPISSIIFAKQHGVDLMTVDNVEELNKIKTHFPEARVVIRLRVGDPTALVQLSKKFGVEPESEAPKLLNTALDMHLNVVGVSFHVGGGCNDTQTFEKAIMHSRHLFDLAETRGQHMTLLDIGGGYPGYCNEAVSLYKIGTVVKSSLEKHFGGWANLTTIAEPGRYFAMPSACVVAQIFAKKQVSASDVKQELNNEDRGFMYYLTDGVFGSFNCTPVYRIRPPFIVMNKDISSDENKFASRIWGPTCDSADLLFPYIELPELNIGDWLVFQGMGAYSMCIASDFNGIAAPKPHYVITGSDKTYVADLLRKHIASISQTLNRPTNLSVFAQDGEFSDSGVSPGAEESGEESITNMVFAGKTSRVLRASTSAQH